MTLRELTALEEGQVTLRQYGDEVGRTLETLWTHWRPREGFPVPVGVLRIGRRQGGGRPEPVYSREQLNQFRATQPDLWGRRRIRLVIGHDDSEQVTLAEFADLTGITVPGPNVGGCPPAGPDGLFRLGDLATWQNTRPASAGPELALTRLGSGALVTLGAFARLVHRDRKTVTQYRGRDGAGFPPPAQGRQWRLETLAAWWNSRPGSGRRPATRQHSLQPGGDGGCPSVTGVPSAPPRRLRGRLGPRCRRGGVSQR